MKIRRTDSPKNRIINPELDYNAYDTIPIYSQFRYNMSPDLIKYNARYNNNYISHSIIFTFLYLISFLLSYKIFIFVLICSVLVNTDIIHQLLQQLDR